MPKTAEANTLLVDLRGQGNDGAGGHDAWSTTSYARLNLARLLLYILMRRISRNRRSLRRIRRVDRIDAVEAHADTNARQADHLRQYRSRILARLTEFLHSDSTADKVTPSEFKITVNGVDLRAELNAPLDAATNVEPNVVMAPGAPGSVEKERSNSAVSASAHSSTQNKTAEFRWVLTF